MEEIIAVNGHLIVELLMEIMEMELLLLTLRLRIPLALAIQRDRFFA